MVSKRIVVSPEDRAELERIEGLGDRPRSGRPLTHGPERRALLIAKACTRPPETESGQRRERWTHRELGEQVGISESQAHVILSRAEIRPHRLVVHTPNHASWLNQVECFFGILCRQLLKHGHFDTPQDLAEQMLAYIETRNQTATAFHWTYTGKVLGA